MIICYELQELDKTVLADVICIHDKKVIAIWRGEYQSVVIWDSIEDFQAVSLKGKNRNLIYCFSSASV